MPELILPTKTKALEEKLGLDAFGELSNLFKLFTSRTIKEIRDEQVHEHEKIELRFVQKLSDVEARLINEIIKIKSELKSDNESLRSELKLDNESLRSELKADNDKLRIEMAQNKAEIIKWMFIFLVGSVFTIIASLFGILKLFLSP